MNFLILGPAFNLIKFLISTWNNIQDPDLRIKYKKNITNTSKMVLANLAKLKKKCFIKINLDTKISEKLKSF